MVEKIRRQQILELCKSLFDDYSEFLTSFDASTIKSVLNSQDEIEFIQNAQDLLLPIVERIWSIELESGKYVVISWNKFPEKKRVHDILFATLSLKDDIIDFCGITTGIQYEISYDSIIGALPKDGATLIEDVAKYGEYTIATLGDKVINSYNCATRFITPKQLIDRKDNNFLSKHNELVLNAHLVREIGEISLDCGRVS